MTNLNKRQRDYAREYAKRIERGLKQGLTKRQARGHAPKKKRKAALARVEGPNLDPILDEGLKLIRQGRSLRAAAKEIGTSPGRLQRYGVKKRSLRKKGKRWVFKPDRTRTREITIYSGGRTLTITVKGFAASSQVTSYLAAVRVFLLTNDTAHLERFVGKSVTDATGKRHIFETRPNVLYRLTSSGKGAYEQIYRLTN